MTTTNMVAIAYNYRTMIMIGPRTVSMEWMRCFIWLILRRRRFKRPAWTLANVSAAFAIARQSTQKLFDNVQRDTGKGRVSSETLEPGGSDSLMTKIQ